MDMLALDGLLAACNEAQQQRDQAAERRREERERWLASQLERAAAADHERAAPSSPPPRQPDPSLPAGVNALLRGQDLSTSDDHAAWLEEQLSRHHRLPFAPAAAASPLGERHEGTAIGDEGHAEWLETQLQLRVATGGRDGSLDGCLAGVPAGHAGSAGHSDWLDTQLRVARLRSPRPAPRAPPAWVGAAPSTPPAGALRARVERNDH